MRELLCQPHFSANQAAFFSGDLLVKTQGCCLPEKSGQIFHVDLLTKESPRLLHFQRAVWFSLVIIPFEDVSFLPLPVFLSGKDVSFKKKC